MKQVLKPFVLLALSLFLSLPSLLGQKTVALDSLSSAKADSLENSLSDSLQVQKEDKAVFTQIQVDNSKRLKALEEKEWIPNPNKAMLWAILPGGGQVYNRKYWKLPIVWGAFMTCYYSVSWNQRMYNEYHSAYRDIKSEDPSKNTAWLAFAPKGAKAEDYKKYDYLKRNLARGNKFYRRYRDLSIVSAIIVYGLSVLDAYVDAELATFDISPDLSLQITPCFTPNPQEPERLQMGLGCSIRF